MARPRLVDLSTKRTTAAERETEIERIARQLARVEETVTWGRVQNDAWDRLCHFIFRVRTADGVAERARGIALPAGVDPKEFADYVLRRWYCFWGARLAELLFLTHPNVLAGPPKDRLVDFTIDGVPFDLKTSEVPIALAGLLADPGANASTVAAWLYRHQSRERRFHLANRIYLVLHQPNAPEEAWRLRGDVTALRASIDGFLAQPHFVNLSLPGPDGNRHPIVTAIIAVTAPISTRQLGLALEIDRPPPSRPPADAPVVSDLQMNLPI
ncbi:MAG TPA: hypothetical protein VKT80_15270 [Chloroflexota bacterium]|nr:hypothetical protein [Chloroflexota bacterium]